MDNKRVLEVALTVLVAIFLLVAAVDDVAFSIRALVKVFGGFAPEGRGAERSGVEDGAVVKPRGNIEVMEEARQEGFVQQRADVEAIRCDQVGTAAAVVEPGADDIAQSGEYFRHSARISCVRRMTPSQVAVSAPNGAFGLYSRAAGKTLSTCTPSAPSRASRANWSTMIFRNCGKAGSANVMRFG